MSSSDDLDKRLEEMRKKVGQNFDDFIKQHKIEMIQQYRSEYHRALALADQASERGDIYEAHLHLKMAKHAKELIRLQEESD